MGEKNIWKQLGSAADGSMYLMAHAKTSESFKAKFKSATGSDEVTLGTQQAYDIMNIFAQMISKYGTNSVAVKTALYNIDFDGVSGQIRMDSNGDLIGAKYDVMKVGSGKASKLYVIG